MTGLSGRYYYDLLTDLQLKGAQVGSRGLKGAQEGSRGSKGVQGGYKGAKGVKGSGPGPGPGPDLHLYNLLRLVFGFEANLGDLLSLF